MEENTIKKDGENIIDSSSMSNISKFERSPDLDNIFMMMEKLLHWAAIIDSSDDAIISKSKEGYITSWNKGAQALYGYTPEEIIGKPVSHLMPPDKEDDFPMIMNRLNKCEKVEHYETKRVKKNGEILDVSITVSPLRDSSGNIIGASKIARDITERIENEKRKDEFISTASHELKTPITSQKIYGELLEEMVLKNGDEKYLYFVKKINNQTTKLTNLINDLLELSKFQHGQLALAKDILNINDLLKEQISDLSYTSAHHISFNTNHNVDFVGDKDRIGQVILNLLTNAIKYSSPDKEIEINSISDENSITISFKDYGIGISKNYHKRIFERFFRVSGADEKTYPGMGIGLNFCKEIVERHNGKIWVQSEPGIGSEFFITLPLVTK